MKNYVAFVALAIALVTNAAAQTEVPDKPAVVVDTLSENLYRLDCRVGTDQVATIASVGPDGILLVDAGYRGTADQLMATIRALDAAAELKYFVLTHIHNDHTGALALLDSSVTFMAHPAAAERLSGNYFALAPVTTGRQPDSLIDAPISMTFNGEEIRIWPVFGAHTDTDHGATPGSLVGSSGSAPVAPEDRIPPRTHEGRSISGVHGRRRAARPGR